MKVQALQGGFYPTFRPSPQALMFEDATGLARSCVRPHVDCDVGTCRNFLPYGYLRRRVVWY